MDNLDELRRIYRSLNDEALLAMNREELTAEARVCYDAELAGRGLKSAPPAAPDLEPRPACAPECGEMAEAAVFLNREDAKLAQALLESEDIPAHLGGEHTDVYGKGLSGFRLFVPAACLDLARELLQTEVSEEDLAAQAESGEIEDDEDAGWR